MPHVLTQLLSNEQQVSKERKMPDCCRDPKDRRAREQTVFSGFAQRQFPDFHFQISCVPLR